MVQSHPRPLFALASVEETGSPRSQGVKQQFPKGKFLPSGIWFLSQAWIALLLIPDHAAHCMLAGCSLLELPSQGKESRPGALQPVVRCRSYMRTLPPTEFSEHRKAARLAWLRRLGGTGVNMEIRPPGTLGSVESSGFPVLVPKPGPAIIPIVCRSGRLLTHHWRALQAFKTGAWPLLN